MTRKAMTLIAVLILLGALGYGLAQDRGAPLPMADPTPAFFPTFGKSEVHVWLESKERITVWIRPATEAERYAVFPLVVDVLFCTQVLQANVAVHYPGGECTVDESTVQVIAGGCQAELEGECGPNTGIRVTAAGGK